ncbi:hypothetical protein MCB86_18300 [Pseudomonas sp. KSR10]|uniref:hypothetical protein n=1 Tax=Pseudomonas sp. KSR10 TaxID=2916654 RepID=UPI001EF78627|nr:hypothetical protein [Pseudomonas sp. KSR10]MCG6542029.1 hypothetical protein [Pseudomonas sp. KSR10]
MNIRVKLAFLLVSFINIGCSIASTNITEPGGGTGKNVIPSSFVGRWSPDCERIGGFNMKEKDRVIIEVNSNQIYILAHGDFSERSSTLFLSRPEDLGMGGMRLSWDRYSRREPIAQLRLLSEGKAFVEWLGFYSEVSKIKEWVEEPDFVAANSKIFTKCGD